MGDTTRGPGWWLASDGRWYPPESVPASTTPERPRGDDEPQGDDWWLAADGRWYPPGVHPDALPAAPSSRRQGRARPTRALLVLAVAVLTAAVAAGILIADAGSTPSSAGRPGSAGAPAPAGWVSPSVHVVGGPVVAGGRVLVIALAPSGTMSLTAVAPGRGTVAWRVPFSPSDVTPDVALEPVVVGGVAVTMVPTAGPTVDAVTVEGIDVRRGVRLWAAPAPVTVVDPPRLCAAGSRVCLAVASPGGPTLLELVPSSGAVAMSIPGPARELTVGLYATAENPPELLGLSPAGKVAWHLPVSTLFGGSQYGPQYKWQFTTTPLLAVGSVGVAPQGSVSPLDQLRTLGIRRADGTVAWQAPGAYQCFGPLPLAAPFVCRYSGSGAFTGGTLSTAGVQLTVQGVDPANGALRWTRDLADAGPLTTGAGVPILDATHVVVPVAGRGTSLLDLVTGSVTSVPSGAALWCGQPQQPAVLAPAPAVAGGHRVAASLYSACTASGAPRSGRGLRPVAGVGVTIGHLFVWPSPDGLAARVIG